MHSHCWIFLTSERKISVPVQSLRRWGAATFAYHLACGGVQPNTWHPNDIENDTTTYCTRAVGTVCSGGWGVSKYSLCIAAVMCGTGLSS